MRTHRGFALIASVLIGVPVILPAGVPPLLNYQGGLRDGAGDLVPDGNYSVTFRIWDAETNGAALWQEGRLVIVQDGLLTVLLGSIVPIPDTLFSNPDRWIGLQVGLDPEMSPRQRLVSVPFAWESRHADRSDTALHSLDKTTNAGELVSGSLDTARFSSYPDLLSEGRIGSAPDQVAAGDHIHTIGNLRIIEDTSIVEVTLNGPGAQVLKTIDIPPPGFGHYGRIIFHTRWEPLSGVQNPYWEISIDGLTVYSSEGVSSYGDYVHRINFFRVSDGTATTWFFKSELHNGGGISTIDLLDGGTLVLSARENGNYAGVNRFTALGFYIEFEGH